MITAELPAFAHEDAGEDEEGPSGGWREQAGVSNKA